MGYYYHLQNCEILVKPENVPAALEALRKDIRERRLPALEQCKEKYPDYYAEQKHELSDLLDSEDGDAFLQSVAMNEYWYASISPDGAIRNPELQNGEQKNGINYEWIDAIAAYIEDGGYLEIMNDDYQTWRVMYCDGKPGRNVDPVWPRPTDEE